MTVERTREEMTAIRVAADREARRLKQSTGALAVIDKYYARLGPAERAMADVVLCEWVLSDDEAVRFDGLHLVREFRVRSAVPALRTLASRLARMSTPGAPFELRKVRDMLATLDPATDAPA